MPTPMSSGTTVPGIVLSEPALAGKRERASQLEDSNYFVDRAESARDIYLMREHSTFSLAVLSDLCGVFILRSSAQMVRRLWPKARILILGRPPAYFEDSLYDEAIAHTTKKDALLAKVHALTEEYWDRRGDTLTGYVSGLAANFFQAPPRLTVESDPTKTPPSLFLTGDARHWANSGRRFHGSRLG